MCMLSTNKAVEVFVRGFAATRSFTKPYIVNQVAQAVWMLADAPGSKPPERNREFVTYGAEPDEVMEAIQRQDCTRYALCVMLDSDAEQSRIVATYKALGHRYAGHEPLFVVNTQERASFDAIPVRRITTSKEAELIAKAARSRQILPEHLREEDADCRLYAAFDGDTPIGWVRSIRTHPDCAWVSNMFVRNEYRRKGYGRSLMSAMLAEDARLGIRWSVLLASTQGSLLYPHLGYREQGTLLLFTPTKPKSWWSTTI